MLFTVPKSAYCRDILGDCYGQGRYLDNLQGHSSHYFSHRSWIFWKNYYYCPGIAHKHRWSTIGPIYNNWIPMIVEKCYCGVERSRELHQVKDV
jgi:hypothetical protein